MEDAVESLNDLYNDAERCARLLHLAYSTQGGPGFTRQKSGEGFKYTDTKGKPVTDGAVLEWIDKLAIPPAWQDVWISPAKNGHILATGLDDKGRKQYIYHPKWRTMRDLLKFYRLIIFGQHLPRVRRDIQQYITEPLSRDALLAAMVWILDNTYIRIGNDLYYEQNESVGLATMTNYNVSISNNTLVTFEFTGKSGKDHLITFDHPDVSRLIAQARRIYGPRLFQYKDETGTPHAITADEVNLYLHTISGHAISAKDFRTWGGTLTAFDHLVGETESEKKAEKVVIEAVDEAASALGNTRAVARASYVHPHILDIYGSRNFDRVYQKARSGPKHHGLKTRENELLEFLRVLFTQEFEALQAGKIN
jgi:DNA topoisomerase-1